jgi:DNA-binding NtrC family response regulator
MPGALECLLLYSWPENLRELRGLVRELCTEDRTDYRTEHGAVRNDDPIGAEELPERVRIRRASLRACAPNTPPSGLPAIIQFAAAGSLPGVPATPIGALPAPPRRLAELPSREKIERVLTAANGNMKAAAESLSIDRRRLYRLCEALGIPFEVYRATSSQQQQEE